MVTEFFNYEKNEDMEFPEVLKKSIWKFQGSIEKEVYSRKNNVEFSCMGLGVFGL